VATNKFKEKLLARMEEEVCCRSSISLVERSDVVDVDSLIELFSKSRFFFDDMFWFILELSGEEYYEEELINHDAKSLSRKSDNEFAAQLLESDYMYFKRAVANWIGE